MNNGIVPSDILNIKLLNPSDIISESMETINYNFEQIANYNYNIDDKLEAFSKSLKDSLIEIKNVINNRELGILRNLDQMSGMLSSFMSFDDVQNAINASISQASIDIESFVKATAGETVSTALGGYARQSWVGNNYINSSAFTLYKANAEKQQASLSQIVANSTFYKDGDGHFINIDGTSTQFSSVEDYYNGLSASSSEKIYIDGDSEYANKLEDPAVMSRLIEVCEEKFRIVTTELAGITQQVDGIIGVSTTSIINAVNQNEDGSGDDIVAAIFASANRRTGESMISLNADCLNLNANHKLNLTTGTFTVDSTNFKVNGSGDVTVKGNITANSLIIGNNNLADPAGAQAFVRAYETPSADGYSDTWLTKAFSKTNVNGGLVTTGNLFVGDSNGTITAGIMGASGENTSGNTIRFFAGSDVNGRTTAPFRVDASGALYASNATISGNITANSVATTGTGMNTILSNGNLKIYNGSTDNPSNLRAAFGLEEDGSVVLKFYDNSGTFLYDLGPNGITREGESYTVPTISYKEYKKLPSTPTVGSNLSYPGNNVNPMNLYYYQDGYRIKNSAYQYYDPVSKTFSSQHTQFHEKYLTTRNPTSSSDILSVAGYYLTNPNYWYETITTGDTSVGAADMVVVESGNQIERTINYDPNDNNKILSIVNSSHQLNP